MSIAELVAELQMESPAEIFTLILKSGLQPDDFYTALNSASPVEFTPRGADLIRKFAKEKDQLERVAETCLFRDQLQSLTERSLRLTSYVDRYLDDCLGNIGRRK